MSRVVFRTTFVLGLAVFPLVSKPLWSQPTSGPNPVPLSPGGNAAEELTAEACPTFHWAEAQEAEGYELIVYRVEGVDATRPAAIEELGHEPGAPALRQLLPAGASSWTPSLDSCLEPGGRYAWTVRVTEPGFPGQGAWAEARHFVVREQSRLERILDKVVNRLLEEGELSEEDVEQLAAWGLGRGEPPLAPEPLMTGTGGEVGSSSAPPGLVSFAAGSVPAPISAGFRVDGDGYEAAIHAEGFTNAVHARGGITGVFGQATAGTGVHGHDVTPGGGGTGVFGSTASGRGVYGIATAQSGTNYGVLGRSHSSSGRGVYGFAVNTSGANYGVFGESASTSGHGVHGFATALSGINHGVFGRTSSPSGRGVHGLATSGPGSAYGVYGQSNSGAGRGVYGWAANPSGGYGVEGNSFSTSGYDFYASGNGIDYGPFTGGHEARLAESAGEVSPGMVVSVTGRAEVREEDGAVNLSSTLPTVTLSCHPEDPTVFGVLVAESELPEHHWYKPADGERFATVNALGEGRVWVTDANGPVHAGDYLTTSHLPGYAQRQGDRFLQSHTLGKATETVDWDAVTETVDHDGATYKKALLAVVYTSG